jgi:hypothetical protein
MRLPRPRFRLRTLLVLVALVAFGIGGELMRRRRDHYLEAVAEHARLEAVERRWAAFSRDQAGFATNDPELPPAERGVVAKTRRDDARYFDALAVWHARRQARYERAAARPWEAVESDPEPQAPE